MVSIKYNSGESGLPITYTVKAPHTRYTLKELKKWWGLDEGVTESDLKKGYTWKTNIIVEASGNFGTDHSTLAYSIYLKKLFAGDDLDKIDGEVTSDEDADATVADDRKKIETMAKVVEDWVADFMKNPWGKIVSTLMDFFGMIGDGIQWLANSIQLKDGTKVLYTYTYLSGDKSGAKERNLYTNVGKYEKGAKVVTGIDVEQDGNNDGSKDFTKKTRIPLMVGDLYNVAVGHIDFLDVNFLTGNKDHDEGSPWMILRNFAAGLIHISIYIASAILLVMLIIYGIQIVGHSFDNPEGEAEAKTRLEQFTTSIAMLIGYVVIMGLCIFGSDTFFKSLENRENAELPIRVNVETAGYSFSTTAAGYARYMAGIEDVDEWVEKGLYTLGFIVLAWVNLAVIIFMIVRMFALWILSMIGPIAAALHILNIEGMMSFRRWAGLYISLSLIQVLLSMIYTLILNYAI